MKSIKRIANLLAAVAIAVAASFTLASCGDDEDDPDAPGKIKSATIDAVFYVNQDALDMYDIDATLCDGSKLRFPTVPSDVEVGGKTYKLYGAQFQAKDRELPIGCRLYVTYTLKAGYTPKPSADVIVMFDVDGMIKYDNGESFTSRKSAESVSIGITPDNLPDFTTTLNTRMGYFKIRLDKDLLTLDTTRDE